MKGVHKGGSHIHLPPLGIWLSSNKGEMQKSMEEIAQAASLTLTTI